MRVGKVEVKTANYLDFCYCTTCGISGPIFKWPGDFARLQGELSCSYGASSSGEDLEFLIWALFSCFVHDESANLTLYFFVVIWLGESLEPTCGLTDLVMGSVFLFYPVCYFLLVTNLVWSYLFDLKEFVWYHQGYVVFYMNLWADMICWHNQYRDISIAMLWVLLIYQGIIPLRGDPDIRCHIKILPPGAILI